MSVVIVAGGTGGLGSALTRVLLRNGATVLTTYTLSAEFDRLVSAMGSDAERLEGERVDVTDEAATQQLVKAAAARHAHIDALINAVGGYAGGVELWRLEAAVLDRLLALNLRSFYSLARAVVPTLLQQGAGAIVNVIGKAAIDHPAREAAYAASKAAALAMTNSLAADLRGSGVRVNAVLPSIIDTEANRRAMPAADFASWPKPEDIAEVVYFLCTDRSRAVHGAAIPVYGSR